MFLSVFHRKKKTLNPSPNRRLELWFSIALGLQGSFEIEYQTSFMDPFVSSMLSILIY